MKMKYCETGCVCVESEDDNNNMWKSIVNGIILTIICLLVAVCFKEIVFPTTSAAKEYRYELDPFNCEEVWVMSLSKVKNDFDLFTTYLSCKLTEETVYDLIGNRANFTTNSARDLYVREFLTTLEVKTKRRWYAIHERANKTAAGIYSKEVDRKVKADYIKARYGSNK